MAGAEVPGRLDLSGIAPLKENRDRGESRGSSPPTPPYIRVRIRRFIGLSAGVLSHQRWRRTRRIPPHRLRSLRAAPSGIHPFPSLQRPGHLDFRPCDRFEVSVSSRPFQCSGLRRNAFRLLCPLLTSPMRSQALRLAQSGFPDAPEISRGKTDRLRRTPAGFTTPVLDGRGLRDHWLARPAG